MFHYLVLNVQSMQQGINDGISHRTPLSLLKRPHRDEFGRLQDTLIFTAND
jgi:hypothetical protein